MVAYTALDILTSAKHMRFAHSEELHFNTLLKNKKENDK